MENATLISSGIKCDNPVCDWKDDTIKLEDWGNWINAKCPECNENVLTLEDYINGMNLIMTMQTLNQYTEEELIEMAAKRDIDAVKQSDMFKDAKGLEHLKAEGDKVLVSFNTHKHVSVKEIKPIA